MKILIVLAIVGCALAAPEPEPQFQFNQYNQGRYNPGRYNTYNRYNQFPYNQYNQGKYRPFAYSTPAPFAVTSAASVGADQPALAPVVASVAPAQNYNDGRVYNYRVSDDVNAQILRLDNDQSPDGSFQYSYETSNGIAAQAVGSPRNLGGVPPNVPTVVQGSYSWVAPGGKVISVSYVADENGYRAVGDSIPTPPPIPEAILRSIEYNRQYSRSEPDQ